VNNFQKQFKEFILNDIFWFNKSELNFGIYKIFRQKEEFIRGKLNEIVESVEKQLSNSNEDKLNKIRKELRDSFIPPKLEIDTVEQIESAIRKYCNGSTDEFLDKLKVLNNEEKYDSTKVYEYLYQFFNLYYEKGDFGYTPRSFRTYTIPYVHEEYLSPPEKKNACESSANIDYRGEETLFTWKTKDSYYIKSNKFLNSVTLNLSYNDKDYVINTNIIEKDEDIKDDKKVKQYRLVSIKKDGNAIFLNFNISDHATPKHTIYLSMLSVIEEDIKELNYNTIFEDKKLKEYFEKLPFEGKSIQTSLLDVEQQKLQSSFKELIEDENIFNHLFTTLTSKGVTKVSNIFNCELSGEEDQKQLKSKTSKLMIKKKDYASKVYTKTTARAFLELDKKEKFEFDDKKYYEKLYEKDNLLNFFYRLDRGINLFYAGVDSDYFIHKNLKRFLSVELDKFIKNYIFADTDAILLMDESAKKIATFARVFKEQANIFIDLLSSIEEFQKYIWEKRKMVKSSNYVISSNKIEDSAFLETVLQNRKQIEEWENLGIIKKLEKPNLLELQSYTYPIDTKHFDDVYKYQILSQFENIEEEISGLLIKSENYQALKFLEPKYTDKKGDGKIKCVYIDPPYNTGNDGFVYKDSFKSASWLSMMNDRLEVARQLMRADWVIFTQISDNEHKRLYELLSSTFYNNFINHISVRTKSASGFKTVNLGLFETAEYILLFGKEKSKWEYQKQYEVVEHDENYKNIILNIHEKSEDWKISSISEVVLKEMNLKTLDECKKHNLMCLYKQNIKEYAIKNSGQVFRLTSIGNDAGKETIQAKKESKKIPNKVILVKRDKHNDRFVYNGEEIAFYSKKINEIDGKLEPTNLLTNIWSDIAWEGIASEGKIQLKSGKKPEKLLQRIINLSIEQDKQEIVLDFFGGSGTTAAVAYKMNKKFISVEMNDYFESKMLNRMKYTMFGNSGGIPSQRESGIVQYIELKQYDDIIDNLEVLEDIDYSKVPFGYIYEPDKNQINFRMENELNDPFSQDARFDLFTSLLFHEGLELQTTTLEDDILVATVKDKYEKMCAVVLGSDKSKIESKVNSIKDNYLKIYANIQSPQVESIIAETFKGK